MLQKKTFQEVEGSPGRNTQQVRRSRIAIRNRFRGCNLLLWLDLAVVIIGNRSCNKKLRLVVLVSRKIGFVLGPLPLELLCLAGFSVEQALTAMKSSLYFLLRYAYFLVGQAFSAFAMLVVGLGIICKTRST